MVSWDRFASAVRITKSPWNSPGQSTENTTGTRCKKDQKESEKRRLVQEAEFLVHQYTDFDATSALFPQVS